VANFERWHQAFNGDPVGRERGGVRRYRIMRASDDEDYVLIDLEFDTPNAAERVDVRALVKHPTPA
jgi:hypothetical protein